MVNFMYILPQPEGRKKKKKTRTFEIEKRLFTAASKKLRESGFKNKTKQN